MTRIEGCRGARTPSVRIPEQAPAAPAGKAASKGAEQAAGPTGGASSPPASFLRDRKQAEQQLYGDLVKERVRSAEAMVAAERREEVDDLLRSSGHPDPGKLTDAERKEALGFVRRVTTAGGDLTGTGRRAVSATSSISAVVPRCSAWGRSRRTSSPTGTS